MADEIDSGSSQSEGESDHEPSDAEVEPAGEGATEDADDEGFAQDTREELQEKAGDLVNKIQKQEPVAGGSGEGGCGWGSCAGCLLLVLLVLGGGGFYLYTVIRGQLDQQTDRPDAVEETARSIMNFRLPGGSRGVRVYRNYIQLAVVENVSRPPDVRLVVYRYPASWPRRLNDLFFALSGVYWETRGGLTLGPFERTSDPLCGREVWVETAGGEDQESDPTRPAHVRRACVETGENVSCAILLVRGASARDVGDTVFRSLRCPSS